VTPTAVGDDVHPGNNRAGSVTYLQAIREGSEPNDGLEAAAIEDAYLASLKTLFVNLAANHGNEPVTHERDQQYVERFVLGMKTARRARELALNAVTASVATT
jgi:hypothetical protein